MLEGLISLAFYSFSDGAIGEVLSQWEQMGFFSYLIPFLLIFALVFGMLTKINLFGENRAINAIVALAVGLMALQFEVVPLFFAEIFPMLGVALSIILMILILAGMFMDPDSKGLNYAMLGIGFLMVLIILMKTAGKFGWTTGYWLQTNWPVLIGIIIILVFIAVIIGASKSGGGSSRSTYKSPWARDLRGAMGMGN